MRSRIIKLCLGISFVFVLSGCSAVGSALNPYEDEFNCSRKAPFGTCQTIEEVYADIMADEKKQNMSAPVTTEPSTVPHGFEVVSAQGNFPPYSAGSDLAPSSAEHFKVVKKIDPVQKDQIVYSHVDGDNVAYPETRKSAATEAAPPPAAIYTVRPKPETAYRDASLAKAAKLLKEPVTPIVIPPLVMRILIAPRRGADGELNMAQFSYVMVDKPRWAMGDYLTELPEE